MNSSGPGIGTILTIIFVVLKLTHNIAWSWWWVFSPAIVSAGFAVFLLMLLTFAVAIKPTRA